MSTKDIKGLILLGLSLGQTVALEANIFYVAPPPIGSENGLGNLLGELAWQTRRSRLAQ